MKGWLIYPDGVGDDNYISWYIDKFKARGIDLQLKRLSELDACDLPEFAVMRAIVPFISQTLEEMGVRVFNSGRVAAVCNNKADTYRLMSENGVEILPTYYTLDEVKSLPVVIKSNNGHGGTEVFLAKTRDELYKYYARLRGNCVMQQVADCCGRDVRVYVIGGNIIAAMLRKSDKDFRSNFCLGGSAEVYKLSEYERAVVGKVCDILKPDFVGIDFVFNGGRAVFNEVEDVVGSRMLYTYTDIDIVELYVDYIVKEMAKWQNA
jgi:ribosomal protein S6--L-glutamate ligase/gamma-F420-2:alpha-L-glutamate ligase